MRRVPEHDFCTFFSSSKGLIVRQLQNDSSSAGGKNSAAFGRNEAAIE